MSLNKKVEDGYALLDDFAKLMQRKRGANQPWFIGRKCLVES